jgi:hypothetical protein
MILSESIALGGDTVVDIVATKFLGGVFNLFRGNFVARKYKILPPAFHQFAT